MHAHTHARAHTGKVSLMRALQPSFTIHTCLRTHAYTGAEVLHMCVWSFFLRCACVCVCFFLLCTYRYFGGGGGWVVMVPAATHEVVPLLLVEGTSLSNTRSRSCTSRLCAAAMLNRACMTRQTTHRTHRAHQGTRSATRAPLHSRRKQLTAAHQHVGMLHRAHSAHRVACSVWCHVHYTQAADGTGGSGVE